MFVASVESMKGEKKSGKKKGGRERGEFKKERERRMNGRGRKKEVLLTRPSNFFFFCLPGIAKYIM